MPLNLRLVSLFNLFLPCLTFEPHRLPFQKISFEKEKNDIPAGTKTYESDLKL